MLNNLISISAIIPTKNRHIDLLKAVDSISIQTALPDRLIIIDQSDSNLSQNLIEERLLKLKTILVYIYDPSVTGLVDAKRVGVGYNREDVICFLEDDVVLEADYFQKIALSFMKRSEMLGCCGVITNLPPLPSMYNLFFHLFHRGIFYDKRVGVHGYTDSLKDELIQSNYLSGGTSAFKKEVFDQVPFDTQNGFFMLEDIDFSTRANRKLGPHFYINPQAKLAHYMSPQNRDQFTRRYRRKIKEFFLFHKKNSYTFMHQIQFFWLLIGLTIEAIYKVLIEKSLYPLKGFCLGFLDGILAKIRT